MGTRRTSHVYTKTKYLALVKWQFHRVDGVKISLQVRVRVRVAAFTHQQCTLKRAGTSWHASPLAHARCAAGHTLALWPTPPRDCSQGVRWQEHGPGTAKDSSPRCFAANVALQSIAAHVAFQIGLSCHVSRSLFVQRTGKDSRPRAVTACVRSTRRVWQDQ